MAMLKTLARKFGGCKQIKDYLASQQPRRHLSLKLNRSR